MEKDLKKDTKKDTKKDGVKRPKKPFSKMTGKEYMAWQRQAERS